MKTEAHKKANKLYQEKSFEKAFELYAIAVKDDPKNPDIWSEKGICLFHLGQKKKALEHLNKAVELQPDYSYRYSSRAYIKDANGDIHSAIEDYKFAIKLDPEDAIAHNNLGLLEEKLGYVEASRKRFERADKLIKLENKLMDKIDELEGKPDPKNQKDEAPRKSEASQTNTREVKSSGKSSKSQVIKDVFIKKSTLKEFLRFIGNGFKIKPKD